MIWIYSEDPENDMEFINSLEGIGASTTIILCVPTNAQLKHTIMRVQIGAPLCAVFRVNSEDDVWTLQQEFNQKGRIDMVFWEKLGAERLYIKMPETDCIMFDWLTGKSLEKHYAMLYG